MYLIILTHLNAESYVFYFELSPIWKVYIKEKLFPGCKNYLYKYFLYSKKHSFADILQNRFPKDLPKFTGKHPCQSLFFNKVAGLGTYIFPVNFAKFLRAPFLQNTSAGCFCIPCFPSVFCVPTFLPYRNQSIDLDCKPIYWFLYAVNIGR